MFFLLDLTECSIACIEVGQGSDESLEVCVVRRETHAVEEAGTLLLLGHHPVLGLLRLSVVVPLTQGFDRCVGDERMLAGTSLFGTEDLFLNVTLNHWDGLRDDGVIRSQRHRVSFQFVVFCDPPTREKLRGSV